MRRRCFARLRLCAIFASALFTSPCLPAQQVTVAGRVINAVSGAPVAHATVGIESVPEQHEGAAVTRPDGNIRPRGRGPSALQFVLGELTTDADGGFRFTGLAPGRYRLRAACRGYLTSDLQQHGRFFAAVVAEPGTQATAEHLRFPLQPLGSISGRVLDSSGDPVQTATISLFARTSDGTGGIKRQETTSLQQGGPDYVFSGIAPGTYYVAVNARPWFASNAAGRDGTPDPLDLAYPLTFFDGADSSAAAQPIEIHAGEAMQANFSLRAVPAVHLQFTTGPGSTFSIPQVGSVAFGSALPMTPGGIETRLSGKGSADPARTLLMTMSVAPGVYQRTDRYGATALNVQGDQVLATKDEEAGAALLSGELAMADGSPLPPGLSLELQRNRILSPNDLGASVNSAEMRETGPGFQNRPIDVTVGAAGSLSAAAVSPGDYRLLATAPGTTLLLAGTAVSGATLDDNMTLHVGATPLMLAATLARAESRISGRVTGAGGRPESGVMVLLIPSAAGGNSTSAPATLYAQGESDSDGTWTLRNVAAGTYRAVAIRDGWDLAWLRPEVMARYVEAGATVHVPSSGSVVLQESLVMQAR